MAETIRIQMMDHFLIYIDEKKTDHLAAKSKKGAALVQYLILNEGEPVPNQKLLAALWDEEKSTNPENALKTLVSRLRVLLNQIDPILGACVVSDRGAYHWQCPEGMTIDLYEIDAIFDRLAENNVPVPEQRPDMHVMPDIFQHLPGLFPVGGNAVVGQVNPQPVPLLQRVCADGYRRKGYGKHHHQQGGNTAVFPFLPSAP